MTKKKFYDEYGNEIRSRPPKRFYRKFSFRFALILGVIFGSIGMYFLGSKDEIIEEPIEQEVGKENKEIDKTASENLKHEKSEKEVSEESSYTYGDFKGTYVAFDGEPYNSPIKSMSNIVILGDNFYQSFNRWDFDMSSTILNKTIKDNILTLNLDSYEDEVRGLHSESGIEQFELCYKNDKKILRSITNDYSLYSMSIHDLQDHYNQLEIDYARIIMTINDKPSLDQWAIWNDKWGIPIVAVSYNSMGDPTEISDEFFYPEDVTHLDLTNQGMSAGIITYSTQGDGYITRYPMPLHYHQEDQSKEGYRKLAEEALNDAYMVYVEPFEPYDVADFIGRVKFVYE